MVPSMIRATRRIAPPLPVTVTAVVLTAPAQANPRDWTTGGHDPAGSRNQPYAAGSSVNAAPAVAHGSVYWGSGYSKAAEGSGNDRLYAFSLDGRPTP